MKSENQPLPGFANLTWALSSGTVYGYDYYTAEANFGGHIGTWFRKEWALMEDWCTQTMGTTCMPPKPNHRWYANRDTFWFRDQRDLTMFILRWS